MLVQPDNLELILEGLSIEPTLALDTETTGLQYFDRPFSFSIANKEHEFDFDERVIPNLWEHPGVRNLFAEAKRTWLYQNAKFDAKMFARKCIYITGIFADIAVAARIVRNDYIEARAYSLAEQAKRHGMEKSKAVDEYIKKNNCYEIRRDFFGNESKQPRFDMVPIEVMEKYASLDARLTYDLFHIYIEQMDLEDKNLFWEECKLTKVCLQMEETGLQLNKEFTLAALYGEKEQADNHESLFKVKTEQDFVNSAKSIQKVLEFQLPKEWKKSPTTGKMYESISADDSVMELILKEGSERDKEIARLIQTIRHHDKRVSTYFTSYLNSMDDRCVIHPTMWQAGTRTGRFSYSDPNLQNIPKDDDKDISELWPVRACFVPRPGNIYVSMDYSQMEYRMMAAYANEVSVIEGVMRGEDFHQRIANLVGIPRKYAKTLNFAILYGAGLEKIAAMLGCSIAEAKILKYKYFMALPKVEQLINQIIQVGKSRGYVKNWAGRKLYAEPEFCYALPNHLIQGGGADVVKKAMVAIADIPLFGPGMVLQIHDQLVFEMTPDAGDLKQLPKIVSIMEDIFPVMNGMKLKVDVSWSAVSLAERDMIKCSTQEELDGLTSLQSIPEIKAKVSGEDGAA
jgi:DNA polymerase-1